MALLPVLFVAFGALRRTQLAQTDPYNNIYTGLSTACLLAYPVTWIAGVAMLVTWRRRLLQPIVIGGWLFMAVTGSPIIAFLIGLVRFVGIL